MVVRMQAGQLKAVPRRDMACTHPIAGTGARHGWLDLQTRLQTDKLMLLAVAIWPSLATGEAFQASICHVLSSVIDRKTRLSQEDQVLMIWARGVQAAAAQFSAMLSRYALEGTFSLLAAAEHTKEVEVDVDIAADKALLHVLLDAQLTLPAIKACKKVLLQECLQGQDLTARSYHPPSSSCNHTKIQAYLGPTQQHELEDDP